MANRPTNILVTGGTGFLGTNFVHHVIEAHPEYKISVIHLADHYASKGKNLQKFDERIRLIDHDVANPDGLEEELRDVDYVVHFAGESHNTRSEKTEQQARFYETNVKGTKVMLEVAVVCGVKRFVHVSTDEVYGEVPEGVFCKETDKLPGDGNATSPYSKSKAQGDELAQSFRDRLSLNIVRPTNNFGPWQHPEKALPRSITRVLAGKPISLWGQGDEIRDWLFAPDASRAIDLILHSGRPGEIYNIAANNTPEIRNRDWAYWLAGRLHAHQSRIKHKLDPEKKPRMNHDYRYGVDATKLRTELGWEPSPNLWANIEFTVQWYLANREWWTPLLPDAEEIYDD